MDFVDKSRFMGDQSFKETWLMGSSSAKSRQSQLHLTTRKHMALSNKDIENAQVNLCGENVSKWKEFLPLVFSADCISTKRKTGLSPFEVVFGQQAMLPIDFKWKTFLVVDLGDVTTTKELLEARFQQITCQDGIREVYFDKMMSDCSKSVCDWNKSHTHHLCGPLPPGTWVFTYNNSA